ncbi:MAG: TetR/AcrR family transcriptional regulator [Burkholderiaceae bacterium]|nr:TetR/AcrR family transcriptional regulator [Burkholderiaceae bacterium]
MTTKRAAPPARPRPRPAGPDGDAGLAPRQRQLLDELETIFLEEGFRKVTLADLASRLRCSRRSFYELADSKEALFLRVFDRYLTRLRDQGAKGAAAVPPDQAFEPYLMPAIDAARKLSATLMQDMTGYPPANAMWERHQRERIDGLRRLVARCVELGLFRGIDPYLVAEVMAASLRRIREPAFLAASRLSYREAVEELYGLLLHGLFRPDARAARPARAPTAKAARTAKAAGTAEAAKAPAPARGTPARRAASARSGPR